MKKLCGGIVVILAAFVVSAFIDSVLLNSGQLMFNPVNIQSLYAVMAIGAVILYLFVYVVWFFVVRHNSSRDMHKVYSSSRYLIPVMPLFCFFFYWVAFNLLGFFSDAVIFIWIDWLFLTIGYVAAMLKCRPV